ncbi:hypothetical protein K378_02568 [Streptomyces sp. Amel2xB2]|uniref:hypothetical protein n=1 Tax=Streptomyces sp. Amel2xB2 TaxID=1305829 RepID=UPI000DBA9723|nr:hypothetical protein [Streptomyces sp. Amel2xB2]RAJ67202.1 hypothetical protein K378_02568 [Streptomyces sp. Amel2xB2]
MSAKLELSQIDSRLTGAERDYVQAFREMACCLGVTSAAELGEQLDYDSSWAWRMLRGRDNALPREEVMQDLRGRLAAPPYSESTIKDLAHKAFAARKERRIRERDEKKRASKPPALAGTSEGPAAGAEPSSNSSLPVPLSAGDRQRSGKTGVSPGPRAARPSAPEFVDRAAALRSSPSGLLSIVRIAAGELSAYEGALALHLLKEGRDDTVADSFLEIYAKGREYSDVMETAVVLLDEFHMSDVASTVLRAALKTHAGKN